MRPGDHVGGVTLEWYGRQYVMRFRVPGAVNGRRPRSDQIAVECDGVWRVMSLREALLALEREAPRVLTRRERGEA